MATNKQDQKKDDAKKAPVPEGFVELRAPEGATGISVGGEQFDVINGGICVPGSAVADCLSHGYKA